MSRTSAIAITIAAALAATGAFARPAPAVAASAAAAAPTRFTIEAIGKGPPVILIPGLSSPRAVWDGVTPDLARHHRVHRLQVNGFAGGPAGANADAGALAGIVDELAAYIRREKLGRPAVVGHSLGGLIGMMLASRHPDLVGRLLVVDAMPFFGPIMGAATVAELEPRAAAMRELIGRQPAPVAAPAPVTVDPGGAMSITPTGRIQVANWSARAEPRAVARLMYEDMTTDLRSDLGRITARPFTVLYAAGMGEAVAKAIWEPQYAGSPARLVAVPGSYHFIMLDQPATFRAALDAFLAS